MKGGWEGNCCGRLLFPPFLPPSAPPSPPLSLAPLNRFKTQTSYQFYSASFLAIYEGQPQPTSGTSNTDIDSSSGGGIGSGGKRRVSLRLVDFAHVLYDRGVDENFRDGLASAIHALRQLAA